MDTQAAIKFISENAKQFESKQPTLGTLMEEVAELTRALEGKHEHIPALELIQIGGIAVNMLRAYDWLDVLAAIQNRYK